MAEIPRHIDLRTVTPESLQTLGEPASWKWRDKRDPDSSFLWPAVVLKGPTEVVLMDGRVAMLDTDDEIVQSRENPPEFGYVRYFVHETQFNVEPVMDRKPQDPQV